MKIEKKKIKRKKRLSTTKFVRTENYIFKIINDDDEMIKNIEIKFAFFHKSYLFQRFKFEKKSESSKQVFKKRTFTKKLIDTNNV